MSSELPISYRIGDVDVKPTVGLSESERIIENKYLAEIQAHLDDYVDRYRQRFGNFVSADKARSLFPEYVSNPVQNSTAVSAPAFAVAENVFRTIIHELDPHGLDLVTILTGGGGSGKTTAAEAMPTTEALMSNSQVIFETLLRSLERSVALIEEALNAGKRIGVIYIHRSIEKASVGALIRAKNNHRIYPIGKLASGHYEAQRTILRLYEKYAADDRVGFLSVDNDGSFGKHKLIPVNLLERPDVKYISEYEVEQRARKAVENEYNRRKGSIDEIPDDVYLATTASSVG